MIDFFVYWYAVKVINGQKHGEFLHYTHQSLQLLIGYLIASDWVMYGQVTNVNQHEGKRFHLISHRP